MTMFRRGFLRAMGALAVGAALSRTLPGISGESPRLAEPPAVEDFREGDVFTIEGRFAFNPITRQPTEHLQRFIVTATTESATTFIPAI